MKLLIICEKPNVATDIAEALEVPRVGNDWFEDSNKIITWCKGHLLTLGEPQQYHKQWEKWDWQTLPLIPEAFQLFPRDPQAERRLRIIGDLVRRAHTLVNACDAGREGELIWREVIWFLNAENKPAQRLWVSTNTPSGIREAWQKMKPCSDARYQNLFLAAKARSQADWLVGYNGTRAATLALPPSPHKVWSLGRVQTALLGLIFDQDQKVLQFTPEAYYCVYLRFRGENGTLFNARVHVPDGMKHVGNFGYLFKERNDAEDVRQQCLCTIGVNWEVSDDAKNTTHGPPKLFNLVDLQRFFSCQHGWTAAKTLEVAQRAYEEAKVITYPRTDSNHLPADYRERSLEVVEKAWKSIPVERINAAGLKAPNIENAEAYGIFDDEKVTDHFAIIPTGRKPSIQDAEVLQLWQVICQRLILAFTPPAVYHELERILTFSPKEEGNPLTASLHDVTLIQDGWIAYADFFKQDLPSPVPFRGAPPKPETLASCIQAQTTRRLTNPPKAYTEDQVLLHMETHKLGTSATRATAIETIISRGYVERLGTTIQSTERGRFLIEELRRRRADFLTHPQMTTAWEEMLKSMEEGQAEAPTLDTFLQQVKGSIQELLAALNSAKALKAAVLCPKTALPVQEVEKGWIFPGFNKLVCPKILCQRQMLAREYRDVLASKKGAGPFEGFISSKTGNPFKARLVFDPARNRIEFAFK